MPGQSDGLARRSGEVDPNGHGTHVAGIIGAGDNGIGIVGLAPQVTIVPVRSLRSDFTG